jgi:hypothetical protein
MKLKKPIIAVIIVIVILIAIFSIIIMGNEDDNGDLKTKLNTDHYTLYSTGQNGFPKIDGGYVYWTNFDDSSIFRYDIDSEDFEEYSPLDDSNYSLSEIYPSGDFIICKYYSGEVFNISTDYILFDTRDDSHIKLGIDAWGISFDYPYVVYHIVGIEKSHLYLLDISTNTTELVNYASWGKISGNYVVYTFDKEAHLYQISTKTDSIVMTTDKTHIEIEISNDKCLILDTMDTGPSTHTDIYAYHIQLDDLKKVGRINEWIIHEEFDGRYLFWASGGTNEDVNVLDTETKTKEIIASGQWIASVATGTLSAENNMVVWASNYEIHIGKVTE